MIKKRILKKTFSLFLVCSFLSSVQFSQVLALEQQEGLMCCGLGNPTIEELSEHLVLLESYNKGEHTREENLENINEILSDLPGLVVIVNILLFIHFGRICLETQDPSACEAMVTHLLLSLFLGILLEGF